MSREYSHMSDIHWLFENLKEYIEEETIEDWVAACCDRAGVSHLELAEIWDDYVRDLFIFQRCVAPEARPIFIEKFGSRISFPEPRGRDGGPILTVWFDDPLDGDSN